MSNPYRYGTGSTDGSTLIRLGTRYCYSATGRFTQQDPAGKGPTTTPTPATTP
jgi:hypothetical protein